MKTMLWLLAAAVLLIALYRYQSRDKLNVTPEAKEQIEKAKQR